MARMLKPPTPLDVREGERSIFLAGSIELGAAAPWQDEFAQAFAQEEVVLLNPRRDEWDSTWVQSIENAYFRGQVEWELDGLDQATLIAMYFDPATKAPITLLEMGLFARSGRLIVGCPMGFWRRGNVEVVCARYQVPLAASLGDLIAVVKKRLG